ncbi:antibiotic biosynthesis monooxygenase [Nakamurella sp. PAMC28650]|uniref:antibiotic biosynthesis monooxygenase n=1 Tax=Nakamurella sp. PAMC28650 TaxID=2762325 RepID=UPI00164E2425|nr:antibiotic biosynthesis monooxygenase [Nakamurella sp. PAMC28650]QNK80434.1 antibiotic biosynthesis monooxygenase [Nakamurella sp. PAMC28650]
MFVLVAHFRVPASPAGVNQPAAIPADAVEPLAMLAASPECDRLLFARSTDAADKFVLVAEFESAVAYRRSISPWPMRMIVIPWLSTAELDHTEVDEVLYSAIDGEVVVWEPTVPEPGR